MNLLQTTWALLTKDLVASGRDIMLRPRDKLPQNKKFQAHGLNVSKALNTMIESLTDAERLVPHLEGLGSRHAKRGLTQEAISKITPVMIDVLRRNVGKDFTKEAEEAWLKALSKAWSVMFPNSA